MTGAEHRSFLLEIGTEEVPAMMMATALTALRENFAQALQEARLEHHGPRALGTPRRLILCCEKVTAQQSDMTEQIIGPARKVAFDTQGNPTRALEGFLKKNQIGADQVEMAQTPKGEYVAFTRRIRGLPASTVLADLLPRLILSIPFPKSMVWTERQERFVRPIHYVLALLGEDVIPFEVAGIRSGRHTAGHLIVAPEMFPVRSFAELKQELERRFVVIDPEERRSIIVKQLAAAIPPGMRILPDPALLDEVVHLVEFPQVLLGGFESRFLDLPDEIPITVLKKHQKYFAVTDAEGRIRPHFLTVLNTPAVSTEKIRKGHQRVLRARLEDAMFYRQFDRRRKLEERVSLLEQVMFQKKLGSYADKVRRLDRLVRHLAEATRFEDAGALVTAARLCKADLTTEMVKEFTELQGIVGGLYARDEGFPEAVCKAIYEHYQPVSPEGPVPASAAGRLLSVADKIDTLCGSFGIGVIPTGSSDPFSLRRHCQGIVRIVIEGELSFSLRRLFALSLELLAGCVERKTDEVMDDLFDFFSGRVRHLFSEMGLQYDVVNAVVEAGYDDLFDLYRRARAVQAIRDEPDFEAIASSYKRIHNILTGHSIDGGTVRDDLLHEPAERELYREMTALAPDIRASMQRSDFYGALKKMARMCPQLDQFFDQVLVMAEDVALRENRLRLLHGLALLFRQVGDLSQIVVQ